MDLAGKTVAVTGVTGFLGAYIALDLLARGANVRGVVRSPEKGAWLAEKGVVMAKADLMDRASLAAAFAGADAIVSNAALYTLKRTAWKAFYNANKVGTENVYDAASEAGVKRIIHVSTCGVYQPRLLGKMDETWHRLRMIDRWLNWSYTVTKSLSEDIAWERSAKYGLQLTVVRPAGIFGKRDHEMLPFIRRVFKLPILPIPTFTFPMSHGADIAAGIGAALERDKSIGHAYNLAGEPISLWRFARAWKRALGKGPLLIPAYTPFGQHYDNAKAKADLGFTNRPLDEGLRDALEGS